MRIVGPAMFVCALLAGGDPVLAGPWPREQGHGFASATLHAIPADGRDSQYHGLYLEYGLRPRLTLGLDAGRGVSGSSKTIVFLRLPLDRGRGRHRVALEFGLGEIAGNPVLRPGLSYGFGFSGRLGEGWVSVDGLAEFDLKAKTRDLKLDATFGINARDNLKVLTQLQAGVAEGDPPFLRVVPSLAWEFKPDWHLEVGVSQALTGARETGVKLGLWRDF